MSSLLVIGGTGFFGKSFLDANARGMLRGVGIDRLMVMARRTTAIRQKYACWGGEHIEWFDGDITSCDSLPSADIVIHAAASTDAANYLDRPEIERRNIQAGVLNFCRLAPRHLRHSKILFASSGAIYGQQPAQLEQIPEDFPMGAVEQLAENKRDYAAAKRDAEDAINRLGRDQGLDVAIARCFAFVGPYLPRDKHFAIGNFIEDGLRQRPIVIKARHRVVRSYMHSDDLVRWLMHLAKHSAPDCPTLNVGSDDPIDLRELGGRLSRYFGVPLETPADEDGYVDRYVPSIERARALGLTLEIGLDEAVDMTVKAIRAQ